MLVQAFPECVIGVQVPGDRLGVGERRLLPLVVVSRLFEIEQVLDVALDDATGGRLDRALVAAVFALHRTRNVQPAHFLDGVVAHTVLEQVAP